MALTGAPGRVTRVNGSVVHVDGLSAPVRFEFVEVGHDRLPGEIIELEPGRVVAQVYEYTGGLRVGEPVRAAGVPLSVRLGPGLLGGIYDGLLRELDGVEEFLPPRRLTRPRLGPFRFEPRARIGDEVRPGDALGAVSSETGPEQLVLVPPGAGGTLDDLVAAGTLDADDVVAVVAGSRLTAASDWPIRTPRPFVRRRTDRKPFVTGQRVLDVLEPIARGSSACVIGGFGEGKTMLLEQVAKWGDADVIVYVGCGERGNELVDLIGELRDLDDPTTGHSLLERTIVLANTSNMPVMAREASIYTAVTVAEHFRDMGLHAVIIADSTSRWAEARRELGSRTGAIPAEEGYPADLPASLAAFYQRAGRVETHGGRDGAVTILTSVSPPGGDVTEPVAAHSQRFVQAVWALDRDLAYARHYPAVSWTRSFSRDATAIGDWHTRNGDPDWALRRTRLQAVLGEADRLSGIADLVGRSALPTDERVPLLGARLVTEAILQQNALDDNDAFCSLAKQRRLVEATLEVYDSLVGLAERGVPASVLEGVDFGPLIRAKEAVGPDETESIDDVLSPLMSELEGLEP